MRFLLSCVAVATLVGCATRQGVARDLFAHEYKCKTPTALRPRDALDDIEQVSGCGHARVYRCSGGFYSRGRHSGYNAPACTPTEICTTAGCRVRQESLARFAAERFCPVAQSTATEIAAPAPEPPPPEIANAPERLALWQRAHATQINDSTFARVTGCNVEATYACSHAGWGGCVEWRPRQ